jgi:hypothetical protein
MDSSQIDVQVQVPKYKISFFKSNIWLSNPHLENQQKKKLGTSGTAIRRSQRH